MQLASHRGRSGGVRGQKFVRSAPTLVMTVTFEIEAEGYKGNCARPPMNRTKKVSEGVRAAQVRQLFVAQHPDPAKRTSTTVLIFYRWLERRRPELLPEGKHADPFQHLKSDLGGLFEG